MSDETILDFSPLNAFLSRLIDIPARIIPYNFQNNIALTKELKFALKSVKEWQNSAKIYPRANLLDKNRKSLNNSRYTETLIGQRISTNISNFYPLGGGTVIMWIKTNVVVGKPVQIYLFKFKFKKFSQ